MASEGPRSPSTAASNSGNGGARTWTSTANITASDNAYASFNGRGATSEWLVATGFGFSIPSGATIDGVIVEAELSSQTTTADNTVVDITLWNAGATGTEKNPGTTIDTTDAYYSWGGTADTWGATLTPAIVNGANFGFAFAIAEGGTTEDKRCDHMRVTVHYTDANQTLTAATIASGSQLFSATLVYDQTVSAAFIASGSQLFAPASFSPSYSGTARRRRAPEFFVAVYGPLPKSSTSAPHEVPISGQTQLSWSTGLPGGWLAAQIGIPDEDVRRAVGHRRAVQFMLPTALDVPAKGHVEIWESGTGLVFEGRLEGGERVGARLRGLDVDGYGVSKTQDFQFVGGNDTDETTAGAALRSILGTTLTGITIGEIADSGVRHTYSEFRRMTPLQALNMLAQEGGDGDTGNRYTWHVYHRTLSFVSTAISGDTTYQIPLDERVIVREDYRAIKSHMRMFYRDAVSGEDTLSGIFSNQATAESYVESHLLHEGGEMGADGASQFLRTALAQAATPQYSITITRGPGEGLEGVGGDTPAYRVLAGETIKILGLGDFVIAGTRNTRDERGGISTQIDVGQPVTRSEAGAWERVLKAATAVTTGRDPNTLSRWGRR